MADPAGLPAIPVRLASRPAVGGLAAPWVSVHHVDGTPVLGMVDAGRQAACLAGRRCQACGQPLVSPLVLFVRARDIAAGYVAEPGLHPECAAYAASACPMLAGTMRRYRSVARQLRCGDRACQCREWVSAADGVHRAGRAADAFAAVWIGLADYRLTADPRSGETAGITLAGIRVRKVRSLSSGAGNASAPSPAG